MNTKEINSINILEKFSLFEKLWTPYIIGELNGQYVKLCKLKNDFVWHSHQEEDEMVVILSGTLMMDFKNGKTIPTRPWRNIDNSKRRGTPTLD